MYPIYNAKGSKRVWFVQSNYENRSFSNQTNIVLSNSPKNLRLWSKWVHLLRSCPLSILILFVSLFVFYNHWPLNRSNRVSPPGSFGMLRLSKIKTFESRQPDNLLSATLPDFQISPPQLLLLSFPFPSSPARVVFPLSPASLRHTEASRREDLQHDSKTLSPVATIHRELESRPNITTLLCRAIHANEVRALYYEQPKGCCS